MSELGINPKDLIGAKKVDLSVVPQSAVLLEALAFEDGARKYGKFNWREKKVIASVYIAAAMRHLNSWADKEEVAEDSGVSHLAHVRACMGILIDAQANGTLDDDRVAGPFAKVLKQLNEQKMAGAAA